ncbi:MAG: respiratory nitrate reductase subunit gamma [Dehalococcoidia bacterium]
MLFIVLSTTAALVFVLGVGGNLAFWLSGKRGDEAAPLSARVLGLLKNAPSFLLSPRTLKAFLTHGLLQVQLLREDRLRWLMSMSLTWGTLELFFVGSLGNAVDDYGIAPLSQDDPWFALLNEAGGLLVLLGVGIAVYRRYVARVPQLRGGWNDGLILAWLTLAVLTGYLTEAGRLISEAVPLDAARYSFGGHAVSRLGVDWAGAYGFLWWLHTIVALSLFAYIPYSKLFHIITGPLSIMARARAQGRSPEVSHGDIR